MTIFKSTQQVFLTAFDYMSAEVQTSNTIPPAWQLERPIEFDDVVTWEQVYGKNGVSVYAAWSPYAEFYVIVHAPLLGSPAGIEEFRGNNSLNLLLDRLKEFEILLPVQQYWKNI
jgi:hypothetical protein